MPKDAGLNNWQQKSAISQIIAQMSPNASGKNREVTQSAFDILSNFFWKWSSNDASFKEGWDIDSKPYKTEKNAFKVESLSTGEAEEIINSCTFEFQPIIDFQISDSKTEMLVRYWWEKYSQKEIHPWVIIDIVENFCLHDLLREKLIRNAESALKKWQKVSINFWEIDFLNSIEEINALSNEIPDRMNNLTIEILETIKEITPELEIALKNINELWINLFMDDFFSWSNNFYRLKKLYEKWVMINWVKIDKDAFVAEIRKAYWDLEIINWEIVFKNRLTWGELNPEIEKLMDEFSELYKFCTSKNIKIFVEWIDSPKVQNNKSSTKSSIFDIEKDRSSKFNNLQQFCCFIADLKDRRHLIWTNMLIDWIQWFCFSKSLTYSQFQSKWLFFFSEEVEEIQAIIEWYRIPVWKFWSGDRKVS